MILSADWRPDKNAQRFGGRTYGAGRIPARLARIQRSNGYGPVCSVKKPNIGDAEVTFVWSILVTGESVARENYMTTP